MKYLLLLNNSADQWEHWHTLSADEAQKLREQELPRWNALFAWMGEQGIEADGLELDDPGKSRVVQVRDGETLVTDGPFAETKEALGGVFFTELPDLDEAIRLAALIPSAVATGAIEIRPLVQ